MRTRDGRLWCLRHPTSPPPLVAVPPTQPLQPAAPPAAPAPAPRPAAPRPARRTAVKRAPTPRVTAVKRAPTPRATVAVDGPDAARRYLAGTGLFELASQLGIGARRLREVLAAEQVTLRRRGQLISTPGPVPNPLPADEVLQLYASGRTVREVARHFRVKGDRVTAILAEAGELRPPGRRTGPPRRRPA